MSSPELTQPALNRAMTEAVEFVHAEGWDARPTIFALVPTHLVADQLAALDEEDAAPLTLIVQDNVPENIEPGSEQLADYVSRLAWPREVAGVILAQEIRFRDTSSEDPSPRPARLFSGALREEGLKPHCCSCAPPRRSWKRPGRSRRMTSSCAAAPR